MAIYSSDQFPWKQHYPTYQFKERDIALEEYRTCAKNLESEERIFINASNITLISAAAISSVIIGSPERIKIINSNLSIFTLFFLLFFIVLFAYFSLKYFSERQRTIVIASRKLVLLRRMLDLDYGSLALVLPTERVEGANEPFEIKMFAGFKSSAAFAFWIISSLSIVTFCKVEEVLLDSLSLSANNSNMILVLSSFLIGTFLLYIYRSSLYDNHENSRLITAKILSKLFRFELVENFENIIYRAKLSAYENARLKIQLKAFKDILIFIEDKKFISHHGTNYRALLRAVKSRITGVNKSGGSTLHHQLLRTLFFKDLNKSKRRKFFEFFLAKWLDNTFMKEEILEIYLASVRFEKGVYGINFAMKHFFNETYNQPSKAQAFFLIERLSNIRSGILTKKIIDTVRNALNSEMLNKADIEELASIYEDCHSRELIKADKTTISVLSRALLNLPPAVKQ